jgi:hypothetical protein
MKNYSKKKIIWIVVGITLGIGYVFSLFEKEEVTAAQPVIEMTQAQKDSVEKVHLEAEAKRKIDVQFSAWDGSHIKLERAIKKSMNDPSSYEHVETKYWTNGSGLIVATTFRGANAFGGKVIQTVKAEIDADGNIVKVYE